MPITFKNKDASLTGKISPAKRDKSVELLLSGYSYNEISKKTNVGRSTVLRIAKELKENLGKNDVQTTIDVAKCLRKKNFNLDDAFSGARIHSIAQKMNFDDDSLLDFISKVYSECLKNNLDTQNLSKYSEMLFRLQKSSEIPLEDIPSHFGSMLKEKDALEEKINILNKQAFDAETESKRRISDAQSTQEQLESYLGVKEELEKLGLDVNNFSNLANMMGRASESDYDASKIADYIKQMEGFEEKKSRLQDEISKLAVFQKEQNMEIAKLDKAIQEQKEAKLSLDKFSSIGVAAEDLEKIYIKILSIADQNNQEPNSVLRKFRDDISQYDKKMGFEKFVSDMEEKLLHLSETYKSETETLKARHAKDREMVKNDIDKLSDQKVRYFSQVKTLSEKHAKLEASAQQIEKSVTSVLDDMRKAALDAISNTQNIAYKSVDFVKDHSVKKIEDTAEKTVSELKSTADSFGTMISDVSEASEKFGRMDAMFPLFEIMTRSDGNPTRISLAMISLLDGLLGSAAVQDASYSLKTNLERARDEFKKMVKSNAGKR